MKPFWEYYNNGIKNSLSLFNDIFTNGNNAIKSEFIDSNGIILMKQLEDLDKINPKDFLTSKAFNFYNNSINNKNEDKYYIDYMKIDIYDEKEIDDDQSFIKDFESKEILSKTYSFLNKHLREIYNDENDLFKNII